MVLQNVIKSVEFGKALLKHVIAGMPITSDEEYNERISVCDNCEFCDKSVEMWICNQCGCYLKDSEFRPAKARWADQTCPLARWKERSERGESGGSTKKEAGSASFKKSCCGKLENRSTEAT
jgi:hypothetical protein